MKASELIADVSRIVRDESYGDSVILGILNRGIQEIASWNGFIAELGTIAEILLPALETTGNVNTIPGASHVALPANFMKNLYAVTYSGMPSTVLIHPNLRVLLEDYGGSLEKEGPVRTVTIVGSDLYYCPSPVDATQLTLHYHRKPDLLEDYDPADQDDEPTCIPDHLHYDLLVNFAAKEIFDEIEDGIDGKKVNTEHYAGKYQMGLTKLYKAIPHKSKQVQYRRRRASFF